MAAIRERVVFEDTLSIATSTPLSIVFECYRYLAKFSFNSQLYYYIYKSTIVTIVPKTSIVVVEIAIILRSTKLASSLASRVIASLTTPLTNPYIAISYIAISYVASPYTANLARSHIIRLAITLHLQAI